MIVVKSKGKYIELGNTVDDSIGEAYDKVARLLGLLDNDFNIHPGKMLEEMAMYGDPTSIPFTEPMLTRGKQVVLYAIFKV